MNNSTNLVLATGIMGGVGVAANASAGSSSAAAAASANSASGREARNLAEKHRRDKLNASIHELSTMVPHVAESTRRLDKTAVLRFAAHGLRLRYVFGKSGKSKIMRSIEPIEPIDKVASTYAARPQFSDTLMQLLDSFFITLTCHGQIVLISSSVEQLLGHCQSDLYGQNLLHITHPEDHALLRQQLIPNDLEALFRLVHENGESFEADEQFPMGKAEGDNDDEMADMTNDDDDDIDEIYYRSPSPRSIAQHAIIDERLREDKRCFTVRLARAGIRSEAQRSYEIVKIDGCFRRSDCTPSSGNYPIVSQLIRRARGHVQHDAIAQAALHGISGNDIVLVAMCRIIRPPKPSSWILDSNNLEYKTRHLIDGRIVDCDQQISLVAGYMKDEVRNLSPFSFMHQDDVRWVIVALRQMYDCNSDYGESCFRLLSRNGNFIYLQSKGYLEIDKNTNKVHSFVCVNTLLDEEEGKRKVQEMKNKFSAIINTKIPSSSQVDVPASQNPQQLEKIVLCLIENLQKRHESEGSSTIASSEDQGRFTKTPPLALVPPEASTVKTSISESVNIVNVTAKNLLNHNYSNTNHNTIINSQKSPSQNSEMSFSPASSSDDHENTIEEYPTEPVIDIIQQQQQQRPSVLQLSSHSYQSTTTSATLPTNQKTPPASSTSSIIVYNSKTPLQTNVNLSTNSPTVATVVVPATITIIPNNHATISYPRSQLQSQQKYQPATQVLQQQISVLKRLHATNDTASASPTAKTNGESLSPVKRHAAGNQMTTPQIHPTTSREIHNVLTTSLQKLDHTLHTIGSETIALHEQHAQFRPHVPQAINKKLGEIIVEQQKQKEILVNIKSEYNVQLQHPQMQDATPVVAATTTNSTKSEATVATLIQQKHNKNNLKISRRTTTQHQRKPI